MDHFSGAATQKRKKEKGATEQLSVRTGYVSWGKQTHYLGGKTPITGGGTPTITGKRTNHCWKKNPTIAGKKHPFLAGVKLFGCSSMPPELLQFQRLAAQVAPLPPGRRPRGGPRPAEGAAGGHDQRENQQKESDRRHVYVFFCGLTWRPKATSKPKQRFRKEHRCFFLWFDVFVCLTWKKGTSEPFL